MQEDWVGESRKQIEFYDLSADPEGLQDVSGESAHADDVAILTKRLDQWLATTGDQGAAGDPATEPSLAEIQQRKREGYRRTWKNRIGVEEPSDAERLHWWLGEYGLDETTIEPPTSWKYPPEMSGSRVETYRRVGETELRLWIFDPKGHRPTDRVPAVIFFFGGGWRAGTPG